MQSSSEVGKVGGRNTRDVRRRRPGGARSRQDRQDRKGASRLPRSAGGIPRRNDPLLPALDPHYRRPIDFSEERHRRGSHRPGRLLSLLPALRARHRRELLSIATHARAAQANSRRQPTPDSSASAPNIASSFWSSMDDDFNTGGAIGDLFELVRTLNKFVETERLEDPAHRQPAKVDRVEGRCECFPRADGDVGPVPQAGGHEGLDRRRADQFVDGAADSTPGRSPQVEELRPRRSRSASR